MNETIKDLEIMPLCKEVLKAIDLINNEYIDIMCTRYNVSKDSASSLPHSQFTQGGCGYYALMLYNIFKGRSKIYTKANSDEMHAICKIGDFFYDVDGLIPAYKTVDYHENNIENNNDDLQHFLNFLDISNIGKKKENIEQLENDLKEIENKVIEQLNYEYGEEKPILNN